MFVAPEGYTFIEADLSQAETRYVAYASACGKLINMLESGEDIHKHVAHAILRALGLPSSDYSKLWRDLGKKTGHGANYMMKAGTFIENVFNDMDKVLTKKEGELILEAYFQEFPEIEKSGTRKHSP
jgi:DNA polymerase I-like protein with 3'-5' exonuclease and polymerase domains